MSCMLLSNGLARIMKQLVVQLSSQVNMQVFLNDFFNIFLKVNKLKNWLKYERCNDTAETSLIFIISFDFYKSVHAFGRNREKQ